MIRGRAREALTAFLISLSSGRYAEAERALSSLEEHLEGKGEFGRGYLRALRGMLDAKRSADENALVLTLEEDAEELKKLGREFRERAKARGHSDYDRGFFSAWRDAVSVALELKNKLSGKGRCTRASKRRAT